MELAELFGKRLIFVSGKGGVGKTTVSILLGLIAARRKKNVIIVEMNATGRVAPFFNKKNPGYDILALAANLWNINLSPRSCFEEYVIRQVKFRALYRAFFNNKYVLNFVEAVPGLKELLLMGKIYDLERTYKNRLLGQKKYDLIIVDAPATGHGLSALEVPHVVESAVKVGPMHKQARNMQELFADAEKTAFCLVTLAEEMPVIESEQYVAALRKRTGLHFGPAFVNAVMPQIPPLDVRDVLPDGFRHYEKYYRLTRQRSELNARYVREIAERLPDLERVILPFVFHDINTVTDMGELVEAITEAL